HPADRPERAEGAAAFSRDRPRHAERARCPRAGAGGLDRLRAHTAAPCTSGLRHEYFDRQAVITQMPEAPSDAKLLPGCSRQARLCPALVPATVAGLSARVGPLTPARRMRGSRYRS